MGVSKGGAAETQKKNLQPGQIEGRRNRLWSKKGEGLGR